MKKFVIYIFFWLNNISLLLFFGEFHPHDFPPLFSSIFVSLLHPFFILAIFNNPKAVWFWLPSIFFWLTLILADFYSVKLSEKARKLTKILLMIYVGFFPINFVFLLALQDIKLYGLSQLTISFFASLLHPILFLLIENKSNSFWFWTPTTLFWISSFLTLLYLKKYIREDQ